MARGRGYRDAAFNKQGSSPVWLQILVRGEMSADASPFGVRVLHHECHTVLRVEGEVDLATAPELREYLHNVIADADGPILVDLAKVTYIGSTGLRAIFAAEAELDEQGRTLRVVDASVQVRRLFELCGILDMIVDDPQTSGDGAMSASFDEHVPEAARWD
jgi:anti-sigma B factor antagonist